MLKGDCETGLRQYKAAIVDYQSAQQLDDKKNADLSSRLMASLGNAQLASGDEAGGLQTIAQAERIAPKAIFAYQYLASYYITKTPPNYNAALNPLQQITILQPTNVQAQINIGDIYVRQKNFAAAQAAYARAIAIDPKNGDAQFGLAEMAAAKGDSKSVDAPLQKAISLSPNSAAAFNTAISQLLLSATPPNLADAQKYAEAATKADPNNASGWYSLGIAYADQNKKDQANSALRKAFDLFKAQNDQNGMAVVNKAYTDLNGKDNSLMTGAGRNEKTNQPGSSGM
jgi:tetratricopeptide (TPR) repeat protein